MRPTPTDIDAGEAAASLEHLAAELRAHEQARLDLVRIHECELAEVESRHQSAMAALHERLASTVRAYQASLAEVVALTRMVVDLRSQSDALAAARQAADDASAVQLDALHSTLAARDVALSDARSAMRAAEEELAALRARMVGNDVAEAGSGDAAPGDRSLLHASALFDAAWYRRRYPDVDNAGMDPVDHYLLHGAAELRDPGPAFSTADYLASNPDVAECGANALIHYLRVGLREGRYGRLPTPPAGEDA